MAKHIVAAVIFALLLGSMFVALEREDAERREELRREGLLVPPRVVR